jgi:hypothetical protein
MGCDWPAFHRESLPGYRAWSATFDSYDQYRDDCYYLVQLFQEERPVGEFMVKLSMEFAPANDWSTPEFVTELRARIAGVAATGETNTSHTR